MKINGLRWLVRLPAYSVIMLGAGCATNSTVTVIDNKYQQAATVCEIQFFRDSKPNAAYDTLAKIESRVQKNFFFGGTAKLEDEAYAELRSKACGLGGNAVLIDDYVESRALEFSHVYVWATAIKLK